MEFSTRLSILVSSLLISLSFSLIILTILFCSLLSLAVLSFRSLIDFFKRTISESFSLLCFDTLSRFLLRSFLVLSDTSRSNFICSRSTFKCSHCCSTLAILASKELFSIFILSFTSDASLDDLKQLLVTYLAGRHLLFLCMMKDFLILMCTENGDSCSEKLRLEDLTFEMSRSQVSKASIVK